MSGPLPQALASAASAHALRAQADKEGITIGRLVQRLAMPRLVKRPADVERAAESLPGRTWREMSIRTRTVLVMLASAHDGDARAYASRAWEALAPADQVSMAACARELGRDLSGARCLY
ncbi:hypothetical protein CDN99_25540 [Roseateles aquatilis]|uniref:Uncharacterized protein n=1 Tax=Roseateles aquatilis TaxID=431061 RepID=A0A246IUD8_9BURK|nr:hypothetical protein [Roseateles aquatilis]OWQ83832.1 hypothetical protein CDN99_25540 [Roseateles aquatilis]